MKRSTTPFVALFLLSAVGGSGVLESALPTPLAAQTAAHEAGIHPGSAARYSQLHASGPRTAPELDVNEGVAVIHGLRGEVHRLPSLPAEERYPDWAPADNLVDIVLGRAGNGSPASLGVLTVEFVDAIYRAALEGRTIRMGGGS